MRACAWRAVAQTAKPALTMAPPCRKFCSSGESWLFPICFGLGVTDRNFSLPIG